MIRPKIKIEDYYDGFSIIYLNAETGVEEMRYDFNQEDTREALKWAFQVLGYETDYEVIC